MKTRAFHLASVTGLLAASLLVGCVAPTSDADGETAVDAEALSVPAESFHFSESTKFCKNVDFGLFSQKICSPSVRFSGDIGVGDYTTTQGIPTSAVVTLDLDSPLDFSDSVEVGLLSGGGVCYAAVNADGFKLKFCADAVNTTVDTSARTVSFDVKLTVNGSIGVGGVGVSQSVKIFQTPKITVPY